MSYEARCVLMLLKDLVESEAVTRETVIELAKVVAKGDHLILGLQIADDRKRAATL